jgi:hypothetical protein
MVAITDQPFPKRTADESGEAGQQDVQAGPPIAP